jgi:tetratricopeptide (TPR) repeat protein
MALDDVFTNQQSLSDYISNRDRFKFEKSLAKQAQFLQAAQIQPLIAQLSSLGANATMSLESLEASLGFKLDDIEGVIKDFRNDLIVLMGDVIWKLEVQSETLTSILATLQAPLDTAAKELRARAVDAYNNGWYEEALNDFLESERKNYQDFLVCRYIANIFFYHLNDPAKALDYFRKAAKYAEPRNASLSAEANYFAGVAAGVLHDFRPGLEHLKNAIRLNPSFPEASFEAAGFAAMLGQVKEMEDYLQQAIRGNAGNFERVKENCMFDEIRTPVNQLLQQLSSESHEEAAASLREFDRIVETVKKSGSDQLENYLQTLELLRKTTNQSGYITDRDLIYTVSELRKRCFRDAKDAVRAKIKENETRCEDLEKSHKSKVMTIRWTLEKHLYDRSSLKSRFKDWDAGCATYILLWIAWVFVLFVLLDAKRWKATLIVLFVVFGVPCLIPPIVNGIRYYAEVVVPRKELERKIVTERLRVRALEDAAELEAKETKRMLQSECLVLQSLLAKCESHEHL